jgi:hypothetical protein
MIEANRQHRFPFSLRTLLFAVAIVALLLVVVIQQVQIGHQREQIRRLRQNVDRGSIEFYKFLEAARELEVRGSR